MAPRIKIEPVNLPRFCASEILQQPFIYAVPKGEHPSCALCRTCGQLPLVGAPACLGLDLSVQLIAENLTVERGERVILRALSLTALKGEALVLVGPNGAGKTTLLRTMAGFLKPAQGALRLEGGDPELTPGEQAHFVGHANAIKAHLTVRENVAFWAHYLGGVEPAQERIDAALDHFAIAGLADFPAAYLSAGQKRRAGLARLLVAKRPLWLLDEPTVSLDAASTRLLAKAVNQHLDDGGLVVAATHLPLGFAKAREFDLSAARGRAAA